MRMAARRMTMVNLSEYHQNILMRFDTIKMKET
eukprot:CAMPEP_0170546626 /NCGR_PEP_ID=MMETSP0211-20121228/4993_1 /TAXON_ID=311385 /ORGANISM="Pseudokeronopsis sp., Strain OXSARD2" /LENGTH=32 /DNA_ID= /DNA_START= /DNA_END= /DNA_ORIENTATION=